MNIIKLRETAVFLRSTLDAMSATDPDVESLAKSLQTLIDQSIRGEIRSPLQSRDVPGRFLFDEKGLRRYPDLERVYAHFKFELTGGSTPRRRAILSKIDRL